MSIAEHFYRPAHYTRGKIGVNDFITDQSLNFNKGSVIKYVCRMGKKQLGDDLDDPYKALQHLMFEIERWEKLCQKEGVLKEKLKRMLETEGSGKFYISSSTRETEIKFRKYGEENTETAESEKPCSCLSTGPDGISYYIDYKPVSAKEYNDYIKEGERNKKQK